MKQPVPIYILLLLCVDICIRGLPRIVHRSKVLGDKEHVPDDSVDVGEQDQVDDAGMGETLDLSYLWVVDARTLPQDAKATEVHGETAPAILGEVKSFPTAATYFGTLGRVPPNHDLLDRYNRVSPLDESFGSAVPAPVRPYRTIPPMPPLQE